MRSRSTAQVMPASVRLGRVAGIPIGLHYLWFIIAALITLSLAAHFRATQPDWQTPSIWIVSGLTALLFFITLLAHELAHALVGERRGLPVHSITLFALGGVAQREKDATSAGTEFVVAVVGPIAILVIGFVCIGIASWMGCLPTTAPAVQPARSWGGLARSTSCSRCST